MPLFNVFMERKQSLGIVVLAETKEEAEQLALSRVSSQHVFDTSEPEVTGTMKVKHEDGFYEKDE